MIFGTKNNKFAIFGQTLDDIREKIIAFNDVIMQSGSFGNNIKQLIPEEKMFKELSVGTATEIVESLNGIKNGTNSVYHSMDEYLTYLGKNGKGYIVDYVKANQNQVYITQDVIQASKDARAAQIAQNEAIKASTLSAKAGEIALKGLAIAGNMLAAWAISKAISLAVKGIDNLIHASENARESMNDAFSEYESAKSEIESLNDELQTTNDRIDELNAKQNLSFVEQEELRNLQETNKELKVKIDLLEKEAALKKKDSAVSAVKSVETSFGEEGISQDNINYKISNYRQSRLEGNNHPETFLMNKDDLEDNITALKIYNELLDEAYNTKDQENIEEYTDILGDLKDSMTDNLLLLYEQKDSMEDYYNYISKQDSSTWTTDDKNVVDQYERILKDIDYINQELSPEKYVDEKISGILAKVDFQDTAKHLEELGKNGNLTKSSVEECINNVDGLKDALDKAGISAEELYQYIMALSNPDAINYDEVKKQLLETLHIRDGIVGGASDQKIYDDAESRGLFEKESLEAFLVVKTKFTDTETASWSAKDWASYIQKEINGALDSNEMSDLSATISSSVQQIATQLEPQFAKLGEAYKAIFTDDGFTLDDVDNSMLEGLRKSFAEIEEEVGVAFDSSKLNSFFDALTNGNSSAEQVQQAFNDLATAYFYSTDTLAQLNEETAASIEKQLEELGVVNAKEVVYDTLNAKTEALALQEQLLAAQSDAVSRGANFNVESFLNQAGASEIARTYLFQLITAEQVFNNQDLNTADKIAKLKELANAYGQTAIAARIANLEKANEDGHVPIDYDKELASLQNDINNAVNNVKIDFSGVGGGTSGASKAGKDAGDAYVEAYEKELKELENLRDRGEISEAEYLSRMKALYEKYFKGISKYQDKYFEEQGKYLSGMLDLYNSALSGISKLLGNKIDAVQEEKDATISALEEERDARLEVIEAQKEQLQAEIDLIDEQIDAKQEIIDGIQDEIDKMREANEERKRQIDLQKAQYELERMQNQRTILQYSEEKGMHYVQDTSGIRDAKQAVDDAQLEIDIAAKEKEISLIEDEIDLLEKQKDAIQDQIDALDKQAESIEKYYDKLIKEQEKMFDSMIKNLENQKSKWEELAEVQEIAEAYAAVKQAADDLGYSVEDLLNGNEAAFEDFKSRYIAIMSDCGQNTAFQDGLEYASGVAKEKFGTIISDAQSSVDQLNQTFSNGTFAEAIAQGVSDGIVSAQQELDKMNQLGQDAGDGFVAGWNEKSTEIEEATKQTAIDAIDAFAEGQDSHSPSEKYKSLANDAIDGLLLGVEEKKQEFIDAIKSLAEEGVLAFEEGFNFEDSELKNSFDSLKLLVESVAEAMGIGTEDSVGGLLGALQQLSQFSLGGTEEAEGTGIISQFNALKEAVDNVTSSISGGSTGENSNGENASGSKSPSMSAGATEGGEGNLVSAIEKMGETATETLGEGSEEESSDDEGAGVIGKFAQLKTAVDAVTTAIGTGEDEEGSGEEGAINLIGALQAHYEKAEETLPEVKTLFEDLLVSIEACATALNTMVSAMTSMSGLSISGGISFPFHAEGTVGKAFAKGYPGLKSREKNALRSEFGQPELTVYPDGTTELTTEPTMSDLPKDTIIFNEEQTRRIMNNSGTTVGKAYANGTVNDGTIVTSNGTVLRPLQPGDKDYELLKKFEAYHEQFRTQIIPPVNAIDRNTELITKSINNVNNRSTQQQISFSTGDIIVQGVQNVDGFAKAVKTHFPNAMLQAIHKR